MNIEFNLIPKFVDEAMSPVAQRVGNSVADLWDFSFGNHIKLWIQKQEHRHQLNYQDYVNKVNANLVKIPQDKLVEPPLHVIGPAIEASKFYIDSEELRELFANLIAASMNQDKIDDVHPSYIEIIKQLSSDEAKILKYLGIGHFPLISVSRKEGFSESPVLERFSDIAELAGCDNPLNVFAYLENLNRLGLINLYNDGELTDKSIYINVEKHFVVSQAIELAKLMGEPNIKRSYASTTKFGNNFYSTCVI